MNNKILTVAVGSILTESSITIEEVEWFITILV